MYRCLVGFAQGSGGRGGELEARLDARSLMPAFGGRVVQIAEDAARVSESRIKGLKELSNHVV